MAVVNLNPAPGIEANYDVYVRQPTICHRHGGGTSKKDDAADVAKVGFDAMMRGDGDVVTGFKNKAQSAVANVTPDRHADKAASQDGGARIG